MMVTDEMEDMPFSAKSSRTNAASCSKIIDDIAYEGLKSKLS